MALFTKRWTLVINIHYCTQGDRMPKLKEKIFTRDEVRALDRKAIEDFGVPSIVLMENAGRGVVDYLSTRC